MRVVLPLPGGATSITLCSLVSTRQCPAEKSITKPGSVSRPDGTERKILFFLYRSSTGSYRAAHGRPQHPLRRLVFDRSKTKSKMRRQQPAKLLPMLQRDTEAALQSPQLFRLRQQREKAGFFVFSIIITTFQIFEQPRLHPHPLYRSFRKFDWICSILAGSGRTVLCCSVA